MRKWPIMLLALLMAQNIFADLKSEVSDLDNRLFNLEEQLQGKFPVSPIDSQKLRLGGVLYHDQRYAVSSADGYRNSLVSSTRMDIMLNGDVNDQIGYIFVPVWFFQSARSNPDAANRSAQGNRQTMSLVSRLNLEYKFNGSNSVTIGRFMAPFGSYVDTYSLSADKLSYRPQAVSPLGIVFAPILDGIMYTGKSYFNNISLKYKVYAAIHSTDGGAMATNPFQQYLFIDTPDKHRYGFRTIVGFLNNKVHFGLSGQFGEKYYGTDSNSKAIFRKVAIFATDLNVNLGKLKLRGEFVKTNEEKVDDSTVVPDALKGQTMTMSSSNEIRNYMASFLDSNKTSYYLEMTYQFNTKFMLATRYDYMDFNSYLFANKKAVKITSITLNYFPAEKLMLKLSADKHDYDATATDIEKNVIPTLKNKQAKADPDYMEYSVSATLSF